MKKEKCYLTKAITISLALGVCIGVALPGSAWAADPVSSRTINIDSFATVKVYENGTYGGSTLRNISTQEEDSFKKGMTYWQAVLGNPKTSTLPVINFYPQAVDGTNASASSDSEGNVTKLAQYFINSGYTGTETAAVITAQNGQENNQKWYYDRLPVLPVNDKDSDYAGTIVHEMFHALGICCGVDGNFSTGNVGDTVDISSTAFTKYDEGLRDINGRQLTNCNTIKLVASKEDGAKENNTTFCILDQSWGGAYFTGTNVQQVLQGATLAWPDGSNLAAVPGVPINTYEDKTPELSHFELQNSLQSHQNYRNWCIPMELELAALQDLGYEIDRSKFYGRSIYNSGTANKHNVVDNTTGYEKSQDWGIGLHVYGSYNDVTQSANIKASGAETLGMRIDGVGNKITVANGTTVAANGTNGRAIAFTYGKNHALTVEEGATVTGNGTNGIALSFDFGSNEMGDYTESRGSYIRTKEGQTASLLDALNGALVDTVDINGTVTATGTGGKAIYISSNAYVQTINVNAGSTLKGDIIDDWNGSSQYGSSQSGTNLITTLNFNAGTSYTGGKIQTSDGGAITTMNVVFGNGTATTNQLARLSLAAVNTPTTTATYNLTGTTVNVNSVTVSDGVTLQGGTYKVADGMTSSGKLVASANADGTAGMTITGNLTTNDGSSIIYAGSKQGVAQIKVTGEASGTAKLELAGGYYNLGRDIKVKDIVVDSNPNDVDITFSNENGVLYGDEGDDDGYISLLDVKYVNDDINGDYLDVFIDQEEVDDVKKMVSPKAARTLQAIVNSDAVINYVKDDDDESKFADDDDYDDRYDELFNLDYGTTQELQIALEDLADNQVAANSAILPQQSTMLGRMIKGRLADVQGKAVTVPVKVTPKALTTNKDAAKQAVVTNVQMSVPYDDGVWVQVDKEWGNVGSANMHSTGYAVGYDKRYNTNNQAGVIFGFAQTNVGGWKANDEVADYRLGIYNGYKKGAVDFTVYGDFGWVNHDTKRMAIAILDETAKAKYSGKLIEIGAEYKYDLQDGQEKIFHVAPYVGARYNHYWQGAYAEEGNYGVEMHDFSNNYFDTEVGVEFTRKLTQGSYNWRVGYKHVWSGAEPSIYFNYVGAEDTPISSTATDDKNFLTTQFKANMPIDERWELEGEANLQLGAHDKFYGVSAMFKYQF